jgi:signal transduction histidine kinase
MEQTAAEIKRLRGCINDLIGILAIPAISIGHEPRQIISTLLDVLLSMLRLDFVYARLNHSSGDQPPIEMVLLAQCQSSPGQAQEIGQILDPWLTCGPTTSPLVIPNPIEKGDVSIAHLRLGLQDGVGVLIAASHQPDFPKETEMLLLRVAANQAGFQLQEAYLEQALRENRDQLEKRVTERTAELMQLTSQMFRLQDEERRRIARELHDGTAQSLFGISMNLAKLNELSQDKPGAKRLIDECDSLANESLQEIRTLSYLLHPPLLDEAGLVSALQWYVQGFIKRSGIYVDLVALPMDRLPADVELALFRIVQESLTNVRRHSGSKTARIRLENKSGEIMLEIQDQGRGMPGQTVSEDSQDIIEMGVGIPGMRQRLVQLGGRLEVTSNSHGTTITAVLPLTNGEHHVENPSRGRS